MTSRKLTRGELTILMMLTTMFMAWVNGASASHALWKMLFLGGLVFAVHWLIYGRGFRLVRLQRGDPR